MPLSALKFHYLQITFFSAVITRTHHLATHTPFFRHIMSKKRVLHLFLKILFFLCTSETLPNHLFRQTNHQKLLKSSLKGEKKIFFFFIIYFKFSLSSYGKKQNQLLFSHYLSPEIGKPQGITLFKKNFFFFFF